MIKQTAVEWLISQIKDDQVNKVKSEAEWQKVFKQALKMEKNQILDMIDSQVDLLEDEDFNMRDSISY
jgi:hypothetical protein